MDFQLRIRPRRQVQDPVEIADRNAAYERLLASCDFNSNPDLYAYFGSDFFHDGTIDGLAVAPGGEGLSFRIVADLPVRREAERRDQVGHSAHAWFRCSFHGVAAFGLEMGTAIEQTYRPLNRRIDYILSEIDTLTEEIARHTTHTSRQFHSLLIEVEPPGMLAIVFENVVIEAEEPLAFHAIRQAGNHEVRLYEPKVGSNQRVQPTRGNVVRR